MIGVALVSENIPLPDWKITMDNAPPNGSSTCFYSPMLTIEAPNDVTATIFERK